MRKWIFLMINTQHTFITCGFSDDILAVIKFYKSLPQISASAKNNYLVYAEEYTTKEGQSSRFKELSAMGTEKLKEVIKFANPELSEITEHTILNQ